MTRTAQDVQTELRDTLGDHFDLRNKFSESGILINRAEKRDWPLATAEAGVEERRGYLIDHALGNKNRTAAGGGRVAIPDTVKTWPDKSANVKLSKSGRVPKSKQVSTLKNKRSGSRLPFVIKSKTKTNNELLVQRESKGRYPLKILYAFRPTVSIDKTWHFEEIASAKAGAVYNRNFNDALAKAIATAKGKAERSASRSRGRRIGG